MSFDAFDISASGLYAQRVRMDTISSNIANVNTTRNADGTPGVYIKKKAVFSAVYNNTLEDSVFAQNQPSNRNLFGMNDSMSLKGSLQYDQPNVAKGVQVNEIAQETKDPYRMVYEPGHPDADKNGFVKMPNVNIVSEMVDMISASRAYDANVQSMTATKNLISSALKI